MISDYTTRFGTSSSSLWCQINIDQADTSTFP